MDLTIGEMARLTGLTVKTIRFYSDIGLVRESERTPAGHRRYDDAGLARLELVRALRDLGLDLATIRTVMERRADLVDVANAHADAIDLHIHQLTLSRAVLRAIARNYARPEDVRRMTAFARASADEARRIMDDFLAAVFAGHPSDPFAARMHAGLPQLPETPTDAQMNAWIELASLVSDAAFRARVGQMVTEGARLRAASGITDTDTATQEAGAAVVERVGAAMAAGIAPDGPDAVPIVDALVGRFAAAASRQDDPAYRADLSEQLEMFSEQRVERYWQLIGVINGWPVTPSLTPLYAWFLAGVRAG
ncbi:MAG: MerR family transcriptional regulator [Actinomycetales bacterium]|jgi:DNA-binding transcriptional MerR regulator